MRRHNFMIIVEDVVSDRQVQRGPTDWAQTRQTVGLYIPRHLRYLLYFLDFLVENDMTLLYRGAEQKQTPSIVKLCWNNLCPWAIYYIWTKRRRSPVIICFFFFFNTLCFASTWLNCVLQWQWILLLRWSQIWGLKNTVTHVNINIDYQCSFWLQIQI